MKKTLISLSLIGFLATALLIPVGALGTTDLPSPPTQCTVRTAGVGLPTTCPTGPCLYNDNTKNCGVCCMLSTVYNVTDWIFVFLIALASLFVIWGALKILMAKDSAEEVTKGRTYITYAALGLLVAFMAKAVPQVVKAMSGLY